MGPLSDGRASLFVGRDGEAVKIRGQNPVATQSHQLVLAKGACSSPLRRYGEGRVLIAQRDSDYLG